MLLKQIHKITNMYSFMTHMTNIFITITHKRDGTLFCTSEFYCIPSPDFPPQHKSYHYPNTHSLKELNHLSCIVFLGCDFIVSIVNAFILLYFLQSVIKSRAALSSMVATSHMCFLTFKLMKIK